MPEGFNPRGAVAEDDALHELAQTMRERGMLQPPPAARHHPTCGGLAAATWSVSVSLN